MFKMGRLCMPMVTLPATESSRQMQGQRSMSIFRLWTGGAVQLAPTC